MDNKGFTQSNWIDWIFITIGLVGSALSWSFDLAGFFPNFGWHLPAIIFQILFVGFSFRRMISLERVLSQIKPKVIIHHGPYLESVQLSSGKQFIISEKGETVKRDISRFTKIAFANVPKHNTELNHAKRVTAKLTYRDKQGSILVGPIYARWSNSEQPKDIEDIKRKELIYRQLDSSGVPEPIDLAFKIDSDEACYAYNNYSYLYSLKHPEYKIVEDVINVEILLIGERMKKSFFCKIINNGKNKPLRVELEKSWINILFSKLFRKERL